MEWPSKKNNSEEEENDAGVERGKYSQGEIRETRRAILAKLLPLESEEKRREWFFKDNHYLRLSEVLAVNILGPNVYIKLGESKDFIREKGISAFEKEVVRGFKVLSSIIKSKNNYKTVIASSWIVAKYPRIIESLGFIISDEHVWYDKYNNKFNFSFDKKKQLIKKATMSREDFLAKYL